MITEAVFELLSLLATRQTTRTTEFALLIANRYRVCRAALHFLPHLMILAFMKASTVNLASEHLELRIDRFIV